ncbi:MAG: hypothetical protein F4047_12075 [Caldilineaceae bacterium SB0670_bin_27]|uniref:Uncharacterized protein n=1 Tax=Caldilineaceae bacterium SB0664_bin_27 TaxID=2605260 RepID=A0A6B0YRC6_9CHLR|nr:hypothetical protein [Caldilineaceae bacterium SB0664_bin_27]MYJ78849.1 hypothetical protein [Caldilineaceae bacterium SB0670_bin_27]
MSIPHKDRVPHTQIPIATPGEPAAALRAKGYPVREQPGQRRPVQTTTALCHGGDSPDKLGLCFDADRRYWAGNCLTDDCDSRAIVHSVQAATVESGRTRVTTCESNSWQPATIRHRNL